MYGAKSNLHTHWICSRRPILPRRPSPRHVPTLSLSAKLTKQSETHAPPNSQRPQPPCADCAGRPRRWRAFPGRLPIQCTRDDRARRDAAGRRHPLCLQPNARPGRELAQISNARSRSRAGGEASCGRLRSGGRWIKHCAADATRRGAPGNDQDWILLAMRRAATVVEDIELDTRLVSQTSASIEMWRFAAILAISAGLTPPPVRL